MKKIFTTIIAILFVVFGANYLINTRGHTTTDNGPEFTIKCLELSKLKQPDRIDFPETVIWSSKTNSCLALFRSTQGTNKGVIYDSKIEDISSGYVIFWYNADFSTNECIEHGAKMQFTTFSDKYNNTPMNAGCRESFDFDPLSRFEKTARELGFKQF